MINTEFSMLDQVVPDDTTLQQRPPVYQVRKHKNEKFSITGSEKNLSIPETENFIPKGQKTL